MTNPKYTGPLSNTVTEAAQGSAPTREQVHLDPDTDATDAFIDGFKNGWHSRGLSEGAAPRAEGYEGYIDEFGDERQGVAPRAEGLTHESTCPAGQGATAGCTCRIRVAAPRAEPWPCRHEIPHDGPCEPRAEGLDEPRFTAAEWADRFDAHLDSCMGNHRAPSVIRECFARLSRSSDERVPKDQP